MHMPMNMNVMHSAAGAGAGAGAGAVDISFVSDSRLLPAHPYQAQGLLSVLGPSAGKGLGFAPSHSVSNSQSYDYGNGGSVRNSGASVELRGHSQRLQDVLSNSLDLRAQNSRLHAPSDRGRLQPEHLSSVGLAASDLEASMNSDSLLMYIGGAAASAAAAARAGAGAGAGGAGGWMGTPNKPMPGAAVSNSTQSLYQEQGQALSPLSKLVAEQAAHAPAPASGLYNNRSAGTGTSRSRPGSSAGRQVQDQQQQPYADALSRLIGEKGGEGDGDGSVSVSMSSSRLPLFRADDDEIVVIPGARVAPGAGTGTDFAAGELDESSFSVQSEFFLLLRFLLRCLL